MVPNPKQEDQILVSICCLTFNHENYLIDALNGFLKQKTSFRYEVIIHDDASTDKTPEIIERYAQQYPGILVTILQTENKRSQGTKPIYDYVFPLAKGKYIALCEGDDYWTDESKLQKQIEFLENNSEYSLCYHKVNITGNDNKRKWNQALDKDFSFSFFNSIQYKQGATLSMVFRREVLCKYPVGEFAKEMHVGDWPLECFCTLYGKGYYMNMDMGVYRNTSFGVSARLQRDHFFFDRLFFAKKLIKSEYVSEYMWIIKSFLVRIYLQECYYYVTMGHWRKASVSFKASIKNSWGCLVRRWNFWEDEFKLCKILFRFPIGIIIGLGKSVKIKAEINNR